MVGSAFRRSSDGDSSWPGLEKKHKGSVVTEAVQPRVAKSVAAEPQVAEPMIEEPMIVYSTISKPKVAGWMEVRSKPG